MTDIPEHLRRRAAEARQKAEASRRADSAPSADDNEDEASSQSKIPAQLLDRSVAATAQTAPAGEEPRSESSSRGLALAVAPPSDGTALLSGPGGHTQRLLTVVKSGSIQDIKMKPLDKVHTWPHLIVVEFGAALACTAFLVLFSVFVNAPLLTLANANQTPNPSKAPWYFLGMQELLTFFHPMVAGMTIPGIALIILTMVPFIDKNPRVRPEHRKFAVSIFTVFMMCWAVLVIIGSFFRGPGFNWVFPWADGLFFEL